MSEEVQLTCTQGHTNLIPFTSPRDVEVVLHERMEVETKTTRSLLFCSQCFCVLADVDGELILLNPGIERDIFFSQEDGTISRYVYGDGGELMRPVQAGGKEDPFTILDGRGEQKGTGTVYDELRYHLRILEEELGLDDSPGSFIGPSATSELRSVINRMEWKEQEESPT